MFTFVFMIVAFLVGYTVIALEHPLKINKTATALLLGVLLWICAVLGGQGMLVNTEPMREYMINNPGSSYVDWIVHSELLHALGEVAEILFFLMGAMTIVELIDTEGGFKIITDKIQTAKKSKLLWILSLLTFFMSAVLDNLTTSIVMVALLRKLIADRHERWFFASMVILAANAGGAWSPIGDVTTIMLWVSGKVSAVHIISMTLLASLICLIVPLLLLSRKMKGEVKRPQQERHHVDSAYTEAKPWQSQLFLYAGVGALVFVPIFKTITHLPPYLGMLGGLGLLWILSEIIHRNDKEKEKSQYSILAVITRIDLPSIMFFLGILLAVNALKSVGHLTLLSNGLDGISMQEPGKYYVITILIGFFSSIVDNVPLVAGAMGMYDFPMDHYFWEFLAYCAGTGGSILIIGSAAGVAVMGLEKIDFIWYLKRISWLALVGYLAGALFYIGQKTIVNQFVETAKQAKTEVDVEAGVKDYLMKSTFYTIEEVDIQGETKKDSITCNFVEYKDAKNEMSGLHKASYVTSAEKNQYEAIQKSDELFAGNIVVKMQNDEAVIECGGHHFLLDKEGKLWEETLDRLGRPVCVEWKKR